MDNLIPKGFIRIAESELLSGTTEVFFNKERNKLLITIDEEPFGFLDPVKLECLMHCLGDVKSMKGRYYGPV